MLLKFTRLELHQTTLGAVADFSFDLTNAVQIMLNLIGRRFGIFVYVELALDRLLGSTCRHTNLQLSEGECERIHLPSTKAGLSINVYSNRPVERSDSFTSAAD